MLHHATRGNVRIVGYSETIQILSSHASIEVEVKKGSVLTNQLRLRQAQSRTILDPRKGDEGVQQDDQY